jgi:tetratricopeptide (TPR) repeat protein
MILALPLAFLPAGQRAGGEPPVPEKAPQPGRPRATGRPDARLIERLVRQLGSPRFAEREAATKQLKDIGEPALAALREAAKGSDDPEVRRRAKGLADDLEEAAIARLLQEGIRLETAAKDYKRAEEVLDRAIERGKKWLIPDPRAHSGDVPYLTEAYLHSARVCRELEDFEKAGNAYYQAQYYSSYTDEKRRRIEREWLGMIARLLSDWQEVVRKKADADPVMRKLASDYPMVLLHSRRYAGSGYFQSAYSFVYGTAEEEKHGNDVQLLFDNGRRDSTLQFDMLVGQHNRVADLGEADFRKDHDPAKVPKSGNRSWQVEHCRAAEGHVYLEHIADDRGNNFFVVFQVVAVDRDSRYVAFLWRKLPGGKVVRNR